VIVEEKVFNIRDLIIISSSSQWKKVFDFIIIFVALYSTYTSTYL
jgi:hypothetical protein